MTEAELRAVVRDAIARHVATPPVSSHPASPARHSREAAKAAAGPSGVAATGQHASHALFSVPAGADTNGPCIIEPAVACNHCGYCKSYGH